MAQQLVIDRGIYSQAQQVAKTRGLSIDKVVENFLRAFISRSKTSTEQEIPDIVMSLVGAGSPVADDDLNARQAYNEYLANRCSFMWPR